MSADRYGSHYYCVKTSDSEVYAHADAIITTENGDLFLIRNRDGLNHLNIAFASGKWMSIYAASCITGDAIAVEHWDEKAA